MNVTSPFQTTDCTDNTDNQDFGITRLDRLGHWEDDARVKIKVAAAKYPFRFVAVTKQSKKAGGGWNFEEF